MNNFANNEVLIQNLKNLNDLCENALWSTNTQTRQTCLPKLLTLEQFGSDSNRMSNIK